MIIDGFFTQQLITELNHNLENARLEKIQQIDQASFFFNFYKYGKKYKLILNIFANDYRLYLTEKDVNAVAQSQFLNILKKHLEGSVLTHITQYLNDRVIIFNFRIMDFIHGQQEMQLIFEAMGKHANLLIVKDEIIIDTYKKMFFEEGRQLLPQAKFEFFPVLKEGFDHIQYEMMDSPKMIASTYMGISSRTATYLFERKLQLSDLIIKPTYDLEQNLFYVCDIFDSSHNKKYYPTLSEMMDDYQSYKPLSKQKYEHFIDKQIKKLNLKDFHLNGELNQATEQMHVKEIGDLIYASGLNLYEKTHDIVVNDQKIILDEHLTLNENAQKQYKLYQKAKRSIEPIENQIAENNLMIQLFLEFQTYLTLSTDLDLSDFEQDLIPYGFHTEKKQVINKKHLKKPNILKINHKDIIYYIGKNSLQNAYITHELSQPTDYWFHVKDAPGSHVLVKTDILDEYTLRTACMLAAYHSSLSLSSSIPVDYTQIKYIKKIPGKPGYQVTYKHFKTMYIDIDQDKINTILHA
ncbi:MAG: NFACT family protein [Acholeplasmataceae bacterium]